MEQAQVRGGGLAGAGPAGSATGGGRGRQRSRCSSATGRGADHSVVSQRGRAEGTDRHRLQNLSPARSPWRRQWQRQVGSIKAAGAIKDKPEAERGSRTGRSTVRARVGGVLAQLATVKTCWEQRVMKSSPVQLGAHVRHCRAKPCRKIEGKEGWTRIVFCLDPVTLPLEPALDGSAMRGPRQRSIELPGKDAGEVERLARRLEPS